MNCITKEQNTAYEYDENDEHDLISQDSSPSPTKHSRDDEEENNRSVHGDDEDDDDNDDDEEDNYETRLARSRDRNREHARRTRLRKKHQLQILQNRVKELQGECKVLKQTIEECSIASILLCLSTGDRDTIDDIFSADGLLNNKSEEKKFFTITGKRKRFVSDADCEPMAMKLKIKGKDTQIGGPGCKAQINWKTGVYMDEEGIQQQLSSSELESLRRERNRMHAKMTRDRKKIFIHNIEKTISDLEDNNRRLRSVLVKQAQRHACVSPDMGPVPTCIDSIPSMTKENSN